MTVDGVAVRDRLQSLIGHRSGADALLAQLGSGMADADYLPLAVAIARLIASTEVTP